MSATSTLVVSTVEGSPILQEGVPGEPALILEGIDQHHCQVLNTGASVGHIFSPVTENGTLPIQELSCSWLIQVPPSAPPLPQRQQQQLVILSFAKFDLDDDDDEEKEMEKGSSNGGSSMCSDDNSSSSTKRHPCCRDSWLSIVNVPAFTDSSGATTKPVEAVAQEEASGLAGAAGAEMPLPIKRGGSGARGGEQQHIFCGRSLSLPPLLFFNPSSIVVTFKKKKTLQSRSKGFVVDYIIGPWRESGDCGKGQFHCGNGNCVLDSWLCNGWDECGDSSDERDCSHSSSSSSLPSLSTGAAATATRRGLGGRWSRPIPEEEHSTNNNSARSSAALTWCSDRNQLACRSTTYQQQQQIEQSIGRGADQHLIDFSRLALPSTSLSPECYLVTERCDGLRHCTDGSDEMDCGGGGSDCSPQRDAFLCLNGRCIPAINRCDGLNDCGDGSDEDGCFKSSVIAAVILGSLICGLLLVIAAGCGIRLYHLRKTLERRWSLIRLQQQQNNNNISHQQETHGFTGGAHQQLLQHRQRSSSIDGEYDEFGRRRPVMGRLPPPTYAAAVLQQQVHQSSAAATPPAATVAMIQQSQPLEEGAATTTTASSCPPFAPSTHFPVVQVQMSPTSAVPSATNVNTVAVNHRSHRHHRTTPSRHGSNTSRRRPAPPPPPSRLMEDEQEQMTPSTTALESEAASVSNGSSSSSSSFGRRLVNRFLSAASYGGKQEPLVSAIAAIPSHLPSIHQTASSSPSYQSPSPCPSLSSSSSSSSTLSSILAGNSSAASRPIDDEALVRDNSVIRPSTTASDYLQGDEEERENTESDTDTDTEPLLLTANCGVNNATRQRNGE